VPAARLRTCRFPRRTDCITKSFRAEGIRGLQRGLSLGVTREVCFNAVRIGLFEPVIDLLRGTGARSGKPPSAAERTAAGLICGTLGGCCINPVEVLKTRFQAQGGLTGFQHGYARGPGAALVELWREEGLGGFFRGIGVSTLRGLLGPGAQLVAYNELSAAAVERGAVPTAVSTHVSCALVSAAVSVACVNPVDVVRTRIFNAPVGWYSSGVDAARQLLTNEGPAAFYKGALTHFFRLGPHMILVFSILEQIKMVMPQ